MLLRQVYEAKGGSYENQEGSKNEPKKGAPEPKGKAKKEAAKKPGKVWPLLIDKHKLIQAPSCSLFNPA